MDIGAAQSKSNMGSRLEPPKDKKDIFMDSQGKYKAQTPCKHDIKCFYFYFGVGHIALQCPNKQGMVMKNHGEVVTESHNSDKEKMSSFEDSSGDDVEYAVEGESFVARRGFNV
jgi:hypothetical protein